MKANWGHQQATALNRKRGVSPRIEADTIGQRPVGGYDDREPEVSWSDGSPTAAARSRRGIVTGSEVGAGFLVRVPGPLAGVHRLTVQLGAWNARGLLQVRIDGQPALGALDRRLRAEHPGRDQVAAIDFGPIDVGQTLLLQWMVADLDDPFGNVTLQAAALSPLRTP